MNKFLLKKAISRTITYPFIGKIIRLLHKARIKKYGCTYELSHPSISNKIVASIFWGLYEKAEAKMITKHLAKDLPVIELGGSLGIISCLAAKKIFPNKIITVEANKELIKVIDANLELNNIKSKTVIWGAIGEQNSSLFFIPGRNNTVGLVSLEPNDNSLTVPSTSIQNLRKSQNIDEYTLISDIEGSEVYFLYRNNSELNGCKSMVIELHESKYDGKVISVIEMKNKILELGFTIIDSHGPVVYATKNQKL